MPILTVHNLAVEFRTDEGVIRAVDGVEFTIEPGETLGIVGESGSGKSVTNLALLGLIPQPPGKIVAGTAVFQGADLLAMSESQLRGIRGNKIAMIFQDPLTSLNPFLSIGTQLTEVTRLHKGLSAAAASDRAIEMLTQVGLPAPERQLAAYPHELSGGMRQRVMIAMALSCEPALLIADEPTTALDVTIQAQILELMKKLQAEHNTAIMLITHDLGVIANMAHRVNVMYAGRVVEAAPVDTLFRDPLHPYTRGLLESMPRLDAAREASLTPIAGMPPNLAALPPGCSFAPRCPFRETACDAARPPITTTADGRTHACRVQAEGRLPAWPGVVRATA